MPDYGLTPTDGVSTGREVLNAGLNTLGFLSSGERFASAFAPGLRKNRLTAPVANAIGDAYANAPKPVRFLADNLLSPIGLASTVLAPVTGGTSLGLRGALGTAARLSTRLIPEAAVASAATLASKGAEQLLPDDAPTAAKIAVPIIAGLAGGAAAGRAIAAGIESAAPAIVRAGIVDRAQAKGLKHVPYIADYRQVTDDVGSDSRLAGMLLQKTGIDPSAAAEAGSITQKYLGLIRSHDINTSEVATTLMNASPNGFKSFNVDQRGLVRNVGNGNLHWNDLMEYKDAPTRFNLTPAQAQDWQTMHEIAGEGGDIDHLRRMFGLRARPVADMGDGKIWFHREALTKDGKRMPRPSDPTEARLWDTAEAAANAGQPINYADPLTNLSMQLKANLDEIHTRLFERDVIASGATAPKAVLATPQGRVAHGKLRDAAAALKEKTDAMQDALAAGHFEVDPITGEASNATVPGIDNLQKEVNAASDAYQGALGEWNHLIETKFSLLPAKAVGGEGDELVPVRQWRGIEGKGRPVYLPKDDVDAMGQWFNKANVSGPTFNSVAGAAQQIGDMMRYFSATADVAAPMMQGLPLLARDPVSWGKMAAASYKALFDPKTAATYLKNNYNDVADMVVKGRVPIASSEMFAALHEGGLGEKVLGLPGVKQTLGVAANRFESGYDTTLLITRAEQWKSMRKGFTGSDEQLGQVVRNLTGGMDTKGLGVGPTQRGLESMFLFAPKLLRSSMALVGQAAKPWTPGGMEAAHTLLRMTMAGAGVMALANTAVGMSNGESEKEIEDRIAASLDPTNGRQFLGVNVGGNWYGMGGQFRSVAQLVYRGITDPASTAKLNSDNPLLHYASGRVSPLASIGLAGTELATGEKLNLLPFQTVDDFPDVAQLAGTGMMPFMVQSLIQNHGNVVPPLFEFFGARTSPITPTDALDAAAQRTFNLNFSDLTGREQKIINDQNPDAVAAKEKLGNRAQLQYRAQTKQVEQQTADLLVAENQRLQAGTLPGGRTQFRQNVSDALHDRFLKDEVARRTLGLDVVGADSPKRQVSDAYFKTFTDAGFTPDGGQVDWNKWDELQSSLAIDIKAGKYGDPSRAQQYLDERNKYEPPPEVKWFFDNKDKINNSGYWDQKEVAFQKMQPAIAAMGYPAKTENDLEQMYQTALEQGDPRARQLQRVINRVGTNAEEIHKRMRKADPSLEKALVENGYIQQPRRQLGKPI